MTKIIEKKEYIKFLNNFEPTNILWKYDFKTFPSTDIDRDLNPFKYEFYYEINNVVSNMLLQRNYFAAWCGYVEITKNHIDFNKDIYDLQDIYNVHGNISYCKNKNKKEKIIGFDCDHENDLTPFCIDHNNKIAERKYNSYQKKYKDYNYAKKQLFNLKDQIVKRY